MSVYVRRGRHLAPRLLFPVHDGPTSLPMPSHEVVIDVIESLGPRLRTLLVNLDLPLTKAAPETAREVLRDAFGVADLVGDLALRNIMAFLKMRPEALQMMQHLGAILPISDMRTSPGLILEMLRVLMPLPVVLAAECLQAFWKGTAIRPIVTLHMLSTWNQYILLNSTSDLPHFARATTEFVALRTILEQLSFLANG